MTLHDSPAATLGALFIAGQSDRGRDFMGGLSGKQVLAGGFGAASAEWAGSQLNSRTNMGLNEGLAQALAGAGVSFAGRRLDAVPSSVTNPVASGIMYNVAADALSEVGADAGSLFSNFGGGSSNVSATTVRQASPTRNQGMTHSSGGHSGGNKVTF